jgi:uncharacterized lipoprotein YddW (UPF0748 family)
LAVPVLLVLTTASAVTGPLPPTPQPTTVDRPATTPAPAPYSSLAVAPSRSPAATGTPSTDPAELRAVWVDAFHDGVKTPQQADNLMAWARQANVNALFVQVRRRGDAYYLQSLEPLSEDLDLQPGFDALAYLIQRAHQGPQRLQVHAWLATLPVWGKRDTPPSDPNHVFNLHGIDDGSGSTWLMLRDDGSAWAGDETAGMYYLDPGNPEVARYTVDVAVNILRHYDVDGIHLDQVRYFEGDPRHWGYNPTSVARFNQRFGRDPTTQPDADDPDWAAWRREQVTDLVRRIYIEVKAVKRSVAVTAAVVGWGKGPDATASGWQRTAPYGLVFQDWQTWLKAGIVDYVLAMDYFREDEREAAWFDNWTTWQRANVGQRGVVIGVGGFLNDLVGARAQLQRARALGPIGVALYSYAMPYADADTDADARQQSAAWLRQIFPRPAPVPELAWLRRQ